ncbi:hypothetical protein PVAP13_3KG098627 [Panicum virgatum]|uniref:Uncharacterized protein n=1 Tax=Panicum virgatum TaxID=38727 RepID=A0A8T0UTF7_PANVG|nr:hypothetical protein PVAP13_3KG098627 [Panicum virgatum]
MLLPVESAETNTQARPADSATHESPPPAARACAARHSTTAAPSAARRRSSRTGVANPGAARRTTVPSLHTNSTPPHSSTTCSAGSPAVAAAATPVVAATAAPAVARAASSPATVTGAQADRAQARSPSGRRRRRTGRCWRTARAHGRMAAEEDDGSDMWAPHVRSLSAPNQVNTLVV